MVIHHQFNNIKSSLLTSHMKESFPSCTFKRCWCCMVIRYCREVYLSKYNFGHKLNFEDSVSKRSHFSSITNRSKASCKVSFAISKKNSCSFILKRLPRWWSQSLRLWNDRVGPFRHSLPSCTLASLTSQEKETLRKKPSEKCSNMPTVWGDLLILKL